MFNEFDAKWFREDYKMSPAPAANLKMFKRYYQYFDLAVHNCSLYLQSVCVRLACIHISHAVPVYVIKFICAMWHNENCTAQKEERRKNWMILPSEAALFFYIPV